ncbi:MAG: hypothetical protein WA966_09830, partial [Ornithinimicrobium sp.]
MRKYAAVAAAGLIAPMALASSADAQDLTVDKTSSAYIVQLENLPLAAYDGGVKGMAATKPGEGEKVDTTSSESQ